MAGLFDSILSRSGRPDWMPTADSSFPELASAAVDDDAARTEEARRRERTRFALPEKRPNILNPAPSAKTSPALVGGEIAPSDPSLNSQSAAVQLAMNDAPAGTGVPFSTQAGMLSPPPIAPPEAPPSVPLPMARPPEADQGPSSEIGARARTVGAPAQLAPVLPPQAQQMAPQRPAELPSVLDRIRTTLGDNSNTLLALGAGFAGAPNIGQGISRAAAAAIPARAADIKQSLDTKTRAYGVKALIDAGVPVQQAIAAQGDPDLKKALIKSYIEDRGQDIQMIKTKDPWGGETEVPYIKNKFAGPGQPVLTPAFKDEQGNAIPAPSQPGGGGNPNGTATYAPGINQNNFDHTKVGEEYIQQFSPAMQSDIKSYLTGRSIPTGRTAQAQMIKQVAKKYGDDIGMPADDNMITQRKEWGNSVANTKSGIGLQARGFQQGLEHMKSISDSLVKRGNVNGFGWEPLANATNAVKNTSAQNTALSNSIDTKAIALSGEAGKLFSGQSGGGVHERAAMKENLGKLNSSSIAAAGGIEAMLDLMEGSLNTLEQRRDQLFPHGGAPRGSEFKTSHEEKLIEGIKHNIAILKGEKAAAEAPAAGKPAAAGKTSTGIPWSVN